MNQTIKYLNPEQLSAVHHRGGNLALVAGAGTGKTTTIAARAAALISEGCWPGNIVLLAFTTSSAQCLRSRVSELISGGGGVVSSTIHGFVLSVLRYEGNDWDVLDASSAASLLTMLRRELALGLPAEIKSHRIAELYSFADNACQPLDQVIASRRPYLAWSSELIYLQTAYHAYKQEHHLLDYDDMLFAFLDLLNDNPNVLRHVQHCIVDEAQDLSRLQLLVIQAIARIACITLVGDPAQAIYGFRGAAPAVWTDAVQLLNAVVLRLTRNYRSSQQILDVACQLAAQDRSLRDVRLRSDRAGTAPVVCRHASELVEARQVALAVQARIAAGIAPEQVACLAASTRHLARLQHELTMLGIPFHVRGGRRATESVAVADLLALLRCSLRCDRHSLRRLLLLISGIGEASADKIIAAGIDQPGFLAAAPARSRSALQALVDVFAAAQGADPASAWQAVWGWYAPHCSLPHHQEDAMRLRDVLLDSFSVVKFLDQYVVSDLAASDQRGVCLSTIHSAKGLEFHTVHLLHLSSDAWPDPGTAQYPESVRVLHVGTTRAVAAEYLHIPLFVTLPDKSMRPVTHAPHISFLL